MKFCIREISLKINRTKFLQDNLSWKWYWIQPLGLMYELTYMQKSHFGMLDDHKKIHSQYGKIFVRHVQEVNTGPTCFYQELCICAIYSSKSNMIASIHLSRPKVQMSQPCLNDILYYSCYGSERLVEKSITEHF